MDFRTANLTTFQFWISQLLNIIPIFVFPFFICSLKLKLHNSSHTHSPYIFFVSKSIDCSKKQY